MRARYSKTFKTLALSGAILAPATTLAVLGLQAYRAETLILKERFKQDQVAIVRLVSDRLSDSARKALEDLEERTRNQDPDATTEARFHGAHGLARHIFLIRDGRLVYPVTTADKWERPRERLTLPRGYLSDLDVENYVMRLRENRRVVRLMERALDMEYKGLFVQAAPLYLRAARARSELGAQALLGLARIRRQQGRQPEARAHYALLHQRFAGYQDREGVSYALLADVGQAELGDTLLLKEIHQGLVRGEYLTSSLSRRYYLRWTVEELARQASKEKKLIDQLRQQTARLFAAEEFGMLLKRHGIAELQQQATNSISSLVLDRKTILVLRAQDGLVTGYSLEEQYLREKSVAYQGEKSSLWPGTQLQLYRLGHIHTLSAERTVHTSVLPPPLGDWAITAIRPAADPIDAMERRQGLQRLGLVLALILSLLVGLFLTYRGVRRESELAQLKSDFASNVSHELKTPLTSIRMYAEMLKEGIAATPADQDRYHHVIIRESERLARLIANVLDFSRLERGTRRYDLLPENIEDLVQESIETFLRLTEGRNIAIDVLPTARSLPAVLVDHEAAVQSMLNLLSNAAKYSPGQPEIEVHVSSQQEMVGVHVKDHGIGIPPDELKRIFEDFYRGPGARRAGVEGTGLGLALVRRHMQACHGKVDVESIPGQGSAFTLWFRVAAPEEEINDDPNSRHRR